MSWIGVDFDGTLAHYEPGTGVDEFGPPVPAMLERVKAWLAKGYEVRIFTARVGMSGAKNEIGIFDGNAFAEQQRTLIRGWCRKHLGVALEVTATKDFQMIELWDDRAVQVRMNTGEVVGQSTRGLS